jgi:hypothetical protein
VHFVITYDGSKNTSDPIFYINGSSISVTRASLPGSVDVGDAGNALAIGNNGSNFGFNFDGKMFDVRIYNRLLTAAEVTTIYNAGAPSATVGSTDGLVFQAFAVRTGDVADYVGDVLTEDMKLRDNVFGYVGIPYNSPVGAAAP